jgi:hypothetical protein
MMTNPVVPTASADLSAEAWAKAEALARADPERRGRKRQQREAGAAHGGAVGRAGVLVCMNPAVQRALATRIGTGKWARGN